MSGTFVFHSLVENAPCSSLHAVTCITGLIIIRSQLQSGGNVIPCTIIKWVVYNINAAISGQSMAFRAEECVCC